MRFRGVMLTGLAVAVTFIGISNHPRGGGGAPPADGNKTSLQRDDKAKNSARPHSACMEIAERLRRFVERGAPAVELWRVPDACYAANVSPAAATPAATLKAVQFAIATVPNPVTTHLQLQFDRSVESIQQAAQDEGYSYDGSWFPWSQPPDYPRFPDQKKAENSQDEQNAQPGVITFRRSGFGGGDAYNRGLVVFVIGEQPTGGLDDDQFDNALDWMERLHQFPPDEHIRILGPAFSGSLASLQRALERRFDRNAVAPFRGRIVEISSGTVSSGAAYRQFRRWVQTGHVLADGSTFQTAMEDDSLIVNRFCRYLVSQGYKSELTAFLSEDETAFGGETETGDSCSKALHIYYPRDIATLRSAYEQQSIFKAQQSQSANNSSTLRGDLSEPDSSDHDTVRSYAGQLTPLTQEAVLLDIANRLKDRGTEFVIIRSTNSLDQIFLSEFLHRSCPGCRVVIDGADLMFTRGSEGRFLRGVLMLSTFPVLTWEQDWTSKRYWNSSPGWSDSPEAHRTFAEDNSEAEYIAARSLFHNPAGPPIPLRDSTAPGWAADRSIGDPDHETPGTWLTVIGHHRLWPLAFLSWSKNSPQSILESNPQQISADDGDRDPLTVPVPLWILVMLLVAWSTFHFYFSATGSMLASPRPRAYFAPVPLPQHPALIVIGSLVIAVTAGVTAGGSGLLWRWIGVDLYKDRLEELLLGVLLSLSFALAVFGCAANFHLGIFRDERASSESRSQASGENICRWRWAAVVVGTIVFAFRLGIGHALLSKLTPENAFPAFWRGVHPLSGVSPLLPELLFLGGVYVWFWCNLRGLALFGDDRPVLPKEDDLLKDPESGRPLMPMFCQECAAVPVENAARPLTPKYLGTLCLTSAAVVVVCGFSLGGMALRTLGEREFGILIFACVMLSIAVILADGMQIWRAWSKLRQLLQYLDRLPLRRTLRALRGMEWGSVWTMSGDVLEQRYRIISLQIESFRHLRNALELAAPGTLEVAIRYAGVASALNNCDSRTKELTEWYLGMMNRSAVTQPHDLRPLCEFQETLASVAGMAMRNVLLHHWRSEIQSLLLNCPAPGKTEAGAKPADDDMPASGLPAEVTAAEEFFVLPYLAFIQNMLGRIRTIALGSLWLFIGITLAISSYPFDPMNVIGGIFLAVFLIYGIILTIVYAQMSRDATLSHITDTMPGQLDAEFWQRLFGFGIGPLLGLLTTLFPSITDFAFSVLQPGAQPLK